ncbi:MAG: hypothetical protein ABIQ89_04270 [Candidatus Saccharimonadales bacterium]
MSEYLGYGIRPSDAEELWAAYATRETVPKIIEAIKRSVDSHRTFENTELPLQETTATD